MKATIPSPQPLPPISRQQFRKLNRSGRWQITTHTGTPREKTSVIDPYTILHCGEVSDDASFFDSYTHRVMMATCMYFEKEFGESAEEVRDFLRSRPKRYWELPQTEPCRFDDDENHRALWNFFREHGVAPVDARKAT